MQNTTGGPDPAGSAPVIVMVATGTPVNSTIPGYVFSVERVSVWVPATTVKSVTPGLFWQLVESRFMSCETSNPGGQFATSSVTLPVVSGTKKTSHSITTLSPGAASSN